MEVTIRVRFWMVLLPLCRCNDCAALRMTKPVDGCHSPICNTNLEKFTPFNSSPSTFYVSQLLHTAMFMYMPHVFIQCTRSVSTADVSLSLSWLSPPILSPQVTSSDAMRMLASQENVSDSELLGVDGWHHARVEHRGYSTQPNTTTTFKPLPFT